MKKFIFIFISIFLFFISKNTFANYEYLSWAYMPFNSSCPIGFIPADWTNWTLNLYNSNLQYCMFTWSWLTNYSLYKDNPNLSSTWYLTIAFQDNYWNYHINNDVFDQLLIRIIIWIFWTWIFILLSKRIVLWKK